MKSEKPAGKRFLIPKAPKGGRNNREITRADIAQVGNHRDSMYEAVLDLN
jgi:hypothetical protein